MVAWVRARQSRPEEPGSPVERETDPAAAALAAKAACEARLEQVRCEMEIERLEGPKKERERKERERLEREQTVRAWREEEAQRRKERRARREAFWANKRKRREALGGVSGTLNVLGALGIPALLALLIYSLASGDTWEILAIGSLTAAAAFAVGALLGFLFGIPRSSGSQPADNAQNSKVADDKGNAKKPAVGQHFTANTNLEQISDWLTKILVGVGLIQIHQVSGAVEDLADGLSPGLGSQGFSVAVALLISFSITGFVSGYLFTRLRLHGAFELATVINRAVKERADTETSAIALVQQQLTPEVDKPTLDELIKALKKATPGVRHQAFFLARRQRSEVLSIDGIEEAEKKELVERTIPVFEALISCDSQAPYRFRLRAELGYARLQLQPPDYVGAKAEFDEAIKQRPADAVSRTPQYELNRAYCTIELDGNYKPPNPTPSPSAVAESVYADLNAVVNLLKEVREEKYKAITEWLSLNAEKAEGDLSQRLTALLERFKEIKVKVTASR